MSANLMFELGSMLALVGWGCLIIGSLPIWSSLSCRLLFLGGRVLPILLSLLYLLLLIKYWGSAPQGGYDSLTSVGVLFDSPGNLAAGWTHFLAFDLFIGRWIIDEVRRENIASWRLAICLPLTFFIGPVGLLAHFSLHGVLPRLYKPKTM